MKPAELKLDIAGARLKAEGAGWQIAGNDPMAHNAPGKEPPVKIEKLLPPRLERSTGGDGRESESVTVAPVQRHAAAV